MSKTVDERVVEMKFDNAQFERNVSTSMSTLDKLKQSLNFSGVSSSLDGVGQKFSAFETIAVGALMRIGSQGVDFLINKLKSLTLDQIGEGWTKYGNKIQAVQTIMAATTTTWEQSAITIARTNELIESGLDSVTASSITEKYKEIEAGVKSIDEAAKELGMDSSVFSELASQLDAVVYSGSQMDFVNEQLERLNWFTDETSYSFTSMVAAIGQFTSYSIPLEQSVSAMQGIATWAALSGQNTEKATHAMQQLAQALGTGAVKLQDWKSIETVNMNTVEFEQTVIDTAVALGELTDKGNGFYETLKGGEVTLNNFRDSLKDGWFTSQVLIETLEKYGGFSVALQEVTDNFGLSTKEMLEYVHAFKEGNIDLEEMLEKVHEATGDTSITADDLSEALTRLSDSSYELGMRAFEAAQETKTLKEAFDYVAEAVSTGWSNTFELIVGNYQEAKKLWSDLSEELYEVFVKSGEIRNAILEQWKDLGGRDDLTESFYNVLSAITNFIAIIRDAFNETFDPIFSNIENGAERLKSFTERLKEFTEALKLTNEETGELNETGEKIKSVFQGVFAVLGIVKDVAVALIKPIGALFEGTGGYVLDTAASFGELLVKLRETIQQSGVLEEVTERLSGVFRSLGEFISNTLEILRGVSFGEAGGGIAGVFASIFDSISNVVRLFFDTMSSLTGKDFSSIRDKIISVIQGIRDKVTELCGPLSSAFDTVKNIISKAFEAIKKVFSGFGDVDTSGISDLSQKTEGAFKPLTAVFEGVKKIFTALGELVKKLGPVISDIFTFIGNSLSKIGDAATTIIKNADISQLFDIIKGILTIGIGAKISGLISNFTELFGGITGLLNNLSDTLSKFGNSSKGVSTLLKIAVAVGILAAAMLMLVNINSEQMLSSMTAITALIGELVGAMALLNQIGDVKKIRKVGMIMIELSAAVLILSAALKNLSDLDWNQLAVGLVGVTALLTELVAAAMILGSNNSSKSMMKGATNALIFATAIVVLASAVKKLSGLSWEELARGLVGLTAIIVEVVASAKILGNSKDSGSMIKGAANALIFAAAIAVLASTLRKLSELSWEELAKGIVGLTAIIVEVVAAAKILGNSKDSGSMMKGAVNALAFSAAIVILASTVRTLSGLSWEELAKGLVGITVLIAEMVAASALMQNASGSVAFMLAFSAAILVLGAALKVIATMSWEDIAKGLVAIAAAFLVLGIAGYALSPVAPAILALAAAMALIGASAIMFGAGLLTISAALAAFAGSSKLLVDSIIEIISRLLTALPDILSKLAASLSNSVESIASMIVTVALASLSALREIVPEAVDVIIELLLTTLQAVAENIQPVVEALLDIVVGVVEGLASGAPKVIAATVDFIKSIIDALADALGGLDVANLTEAIAAAALLGVLLGEIAAMAATAVIALAPLPIVGTLLSKFISSAKPFLDEIQNVDPASLQGAKALAEAIFILTANGILDAATSWLTGGSSMVEFGKQLAEFAPYLKKYANSIKGIDPDFVESSANAAKALAEFASNLPNQGGVVSWFTGDNTLSMFAEELIDFGYAFAEYAEAIEGVTPEVITASANAAMSLAEFASKLPNQGGVVSWFTGDNTLSMFGEELIDFGYAFAEYAEAIEGVTPEVITASANAATSLSEFASNLPNQGGVVSWFTGDNTLSMFAEELIDFGYAFAEYAEAIEGVTPEVITASANAAKTLSELASNLPNQGGVGSWFTGDNTLSMFAEGLIDFGYAFAEYAEAIEGVEPEKIKASSEAISDLVSIVSSLPNQGGVVSWFEGDNTLKRFAEGLNAFADPFIEYANKIADANIQIDKIQEATEAAKSIAEVINEIPNQGGIGSWFKGDKSLVKFAEGLNAFADPFISYANKISAADLQTDKIKDAAEAAKETAEIINSIPNEGGIGSWFTGDNTLKGFAEGLNAFADPFVEYANKIKSAEIDKNKIIESAEAAKALAEIIESIPNSGGAVTWFTGDNSLQTLAEGLSAFADPFVNYAKAVDGQNFDSVISSASAIEALVKMAGTLMLIDVDNWYELTELANALDSFAEPFSSYAETIGGIKNIGAAATATNVIADLLKTFTDFPDLSNACSGLGSFGDKIADFGPKLKTFADAISGIEPDTVTSVVSSVNELIAMAEGMSGLDPASVSGFADALTDLANAGIDGFLDVFTNAKARVDQKISSMISSMISKINSKKSAFSTAGGSLITSLTQGISSKSSSVNTAAGNAVSGAPASIQTNYGQSFYNAGSYLGGRIADGIGSQENKNAAYRAGAAVADSALQGANDTANSYRSVPIHLDGFIKAITDVSDAIESGVEDDLELKPVLDLSDVYKKISSFDADVSRKRAMAISADLEEASISKNQNGYSDDLSDGKTINFTQNNYSPKALSRFDIYRQTRNQLSTLKGLVRTR